MKFLVAFVALTAFASLALATGDVDFKNPVRSAAEDEIKNLPGLDFDPGYKQYSGYLEADDKKNRFWHYWFVESRSNPANDPLVLWLNGGPGCSSMLGLLTELGPVRVSQNGSLVNNPFAWNKNANIIFMESPAGVGFSYAVDGSIVADDDSTAQQNHRALRSFLEKFPQYKNSPLYLTGESYGGVYLPTLAVLVDKDPEMNLKGVAIGNGYLDANKLAESLIYFAYYHGLLGRETWGKLSKYCCDGKIPARGQCHFTDPKRSYECDGLMKDVADRILNSGVNPYNLYDKCYGSGTEADEGLFRLSEEKFKVGREHFDKKLMIKAFNFTAPRRTFAGLLSAKSRHAVRGDPPCTDDGIVVNYLNKPQVKDALHIPGELKTPFTTCFDGIQYTMIYPASPDGLAPQMRSLLDSPRKLNLLVYNGDVDLMCNFFGDEWFVDDLNRKVHKEYTQWYTNNQVSGFVKHYDGITYATVKGSGHMVPTDKPAEALNMFQTFLKGLKL